MNNLESKEMNELWAELNYVQGMQKCKVVSELIYRIILSGTSEVCVFDYLCRADKVDNTVVSLILFWKRLRYEKQKFQKAYQDSLITEKEFFSEIEALSKEKDFIGRLLLFSGDIELVNAFFSRWINSDDFEADGIKVISDMDLEKLSGLAKQRLLKILSAHLHVYPDFLVIMYRVLSSMDVCWCTECILGNLKNISAFDHDRKNLLVCFLEKLVLNNAVINFEVLVRVMALRNILGTYVSKLTIRLLAKMLFMVRGPEDIINLTKDIANTDLLPLRLKLQMLSRIAVPALDYGVEMLFLDMIQPVFKSGFSPKLIKYPERILYKLLGHNPVLTEKVFDTAWKIQNTIVEEKDLWLNKIQHYNEMRLPDLMLKILFFEMETEPRVFCPECYMALVMHYISDKDALLNAAIAKNVFECFGDEGYAQMKIEVFCRLIEDICFEPGTEASMYLMRVVTQLMKNQPQSEKLIFEFCRRKELFAELA